MKRPCPQPAGATFRFCSSGQMLPRLRETGWLVLKRLLRIFCEPSGRSSLPFHLPGHEIKGLDTDGFTLLLEYGHSLLTQGTKKVVPLTSR
jgi:hypothetical protein